MERVSNRDAGNAWTAYILGYLYEEWPARADLNYLDISKATDIDAGYYGEDIFTDLLLWLRQEGFIAFQEGYDGGASCVSLTSKGMASLGEDVGCSKGPLGKRLKQVFSEAGGETRRAAISELVGIVIGAAAKAYSG